MIRVVITLVLLLLTVWAWHLKDPHLLLIRPYETVVLVLVLVLLLVLTVFSSRIEPVKPWRHWLVGWGFCLLAWVLVTEMDFQQRKTALLDSPTPLQRQQNQRLIIGFRHDKEAETLALNGVGGLFITRRNVEGKSFAQVQGWLQALQQARQQAGLPPLIIATDQEGGPVSRLSPLVPGQAPLQSLSGPDVVARAYRYGQSQGLMLARLGVTVNFSPVVDLQPDLPPSALDFHSQIKTRALSPDPRQVISIARPYMQGLASQGITPTLKHFPGLGKVSQDTHHFAARLETPVSQLSEEDWLPFLELSRESNAWIMLSHLILDEVDADNPVSCSAKVIAKVIRSQLGFTGTLVTDDLTMGATFNRGFCLSVRQAYAAEVDYLLIAYDDEKYYDAMHCLEPP